MIPHWSNNLFSLSFECFFISDWLFTTDINLSKRKNNASDKSMGLTVCYLNKYEVTQSIVAELKKLEGARYLKEIGWVAPSQKLTKFNYQKLRFASNRSHIKRLIKLSYKNDDYVSFTLTRVDLNKLVSCTIYTFFWLLWFQYVALF